MNKLYIYKDNSQPDKPTVFQCKAPDILEADKLYKAELGIGPDKQNYIGCQIFLVEDSQPSYIRSCMTLVHCDFCEEQNCDARTVE